MARKYQQKDSSVEARLKISQGWLQEILEPYLIASPTATKAVEQALRDLHRLKKLKVVKVQNESPPQIETKSEPELDFRSLIPPLP
jgi:hypothetical protein